MLKKLLHKMTEKEIDVLYELLLHAEEVNMLGNGVLKELFKLIQKASWKHKQQF